MYRIHAERLAALAPNVIITQNQCHVCAGAFIARRRYSACWSMVWMASVADWLTYAQTANLLSNVWCHAASVPDLRKGRESIPMIQGRR